MKELKDLVLSLGILAPAVLGIIGVIAFAIANPSDGFGFIDAFQHINGPKIAILCGAGMIPSAILERLKYLTCALFIVMFILVGGIMLLFYPYIGWMVCDTLCILFR